jgi:hypothetical protein
MGLRPTQGDEKRLLFSNYSLWKHRTPLCHLDRSAAQWRDLRFGCLLEMFFERAKRSGGICSAPCLAAKSPGVLWGTHIRLRWRDA